MRGTLTMTGCIIVAAAAVLVFTQSGLYDVSAMTPDDDNSVVTWAPHKMLAVADVCRSQGLQPPSDLERHQNVQSGARLFRENCVVCHGAPGMQPSEASRILRPSPPNLLRAGRRNEPAEVFLTVRNGIEIDCHATFAESLSEEQIWSIAAFLHKSRGIAASDFSN